MAAQSHLQQLLGTLPPLELDGVPSPRLSALHLSWARPQTLSILESLPRILPVASATVLGRSWWRHIYCLASLITHCAPTEPDAAILLALTRVSVVQVMAACEPQWFLQVHAHSRDRHCSLEAALLHWEVDFAQLRRLLSEHWRLPEEVILSCESDTTRVSQAVTVARWLLELKRMPSPADPHPLEVAPGQLHGLGLGAAGLVKVLVGLTAAVEDGRRLCRVAMDHRPRR